MKRQLSLMLALLLCLSLLATMVACDMGGDKTETTTQAATDAPAEDPTEAPFDQETTEAPATEEITTEEITEEETTNDVSAPIEGAINIGTAEELIAWANTIMEDGEEYFEVTVNFTSDIDLTGHNWVPIDGGYLDCVTFEGNGHTIKNMTIEGTDEATPDSYHNFPYGFGFIQNAEYDLTFKNLNFDNVNITAWERHVGVFVGNVYGNAWLTFENCHVSNFNLNGWLDYNNQSPEEGGHPIAFRVAGFVGGVFAGTMEFTDCTVKEGKMSGFHNLAGFVGYDATGSVTADCFTNCHVENVEMTFSYCQSDSYTADMPRKFVSVFFNANNWVDNIDDFDETGNTFKGIYFIDYTNPEAVYEPTNFRSWSYDEYLAAQG